MTAQEQQMIQSLADRINNTPLAEKDPDAEQFLQQALGRNPDALYILAQTTLVQQYALDQAQKQLADLRNQLDQQRQQPKHASSFLGNLLGVHNDPPPPPQYTPVPDYTSRPYPAAGPTYGTPPPPPPYYAQPQYSQPQYAPPQSGGFLRGAMQTAAGVAAGAIAFEGIESLMHGFGGPSAGYGGGREEIINNYYGDSGGEHGGLSPDIEDRRNAGGFDDAVSRGDHNYGADDLLDPAATQAASADDSTFDDSTDDTTDDTTDDSTIDSGDDSSFDDGSSDSSFDDSN